MRNKKQSYIEESLADEELKEMFVTTEWPSAGIKEYDEYKYEQVKDFLKQKLLGLLEEVEKGLPEEKEHHPSICFLEDDEALECFCSCGADSHNDALAEVKSHIAELKGENENK